MLDLSPKLKIPERVLDLPDYRRKCLAFPIIDHTRRTLVEETIFYCKPTISFIEFYVFTDRISKLVEEF